MKETIRIVDYDPRWPELFRVERKRVLDATGSRLVELEHIGSTAVPGLCAKPIVDSIAGVRHLTDAERCIPLLLDLGYGDPPETESVIPERHSEPGRTGPGDFFLVRFTEEAGYHLHIVELTSDFWRRSLLFPEYLRTHPQTAAAYGELKRELAGRLGEDREGYTEAKTDFIQDVVKRARSEVVG